MSVLLDCRAVERRGKIFSLLFSVHHSVRGLLNGGASLTCGLCGQEQSTPSLSRSLCQRALRIPFISHVECLIFQGK